MKYDYRKIERARKRRGTSWATLALVHGAPSASTLRSGFYRWRDRRPERAPASERRRNVARVRARSRKRRRGFK